MITRWVTAPARNASAAIGITARYGFRPKRSKSTNPANMESITYSPCAKLTIRVTPKISVRPMLINA